MRRTRLGAVVAILGLVPAVWVSGQSAGAPPQQQQQLPTFRSALNIVPLSVTVLDRQGRPVTDLTAKDFTIVEDGKPREILSFSREAFSAASTPPPLEGAIDVTVKQPSGFETETRRTFLIVLGYGRIQYPTRAIDGAREFVRTNLMPQDLVAVMAFNRATDFTTDHASIDRFLERFRRDSEQLEFVINQYWVHNRNDPLSAELQSAIDDVFLGPAVNADNAAPKRDGSARDAVPLLMGMSAAANVQTRAADRPIDFTDLQVKAKRASTTLRRT